jgi:hypothetical protein
MTTAVLNYLKVDSIDFPEVNWKIICLSGFFITLVLLVFYVWQVNFLAKADYFAGNYEKQISKLSDENKNLQISFAENSFLGQVMQKAQEMDFQKSASVEYVQIPDNAVAIAKTR